MPSRGGFGFGIVPLMPPRPFEIAVSDDVLSDLQRRLRQTRWPEALEGADWDYGAKIASVRELCAYWAERTTDGTAR